MGQCSNCDEAVIAVRIDEGDPATAIKARLKAIRVSEREHTALWLSIPCKGGSSLIQPNLAKILNCGSPVRAEPIGKLMRRVGPRPSR